MPNVINYATNFSEHLAQKYTEELKTTALTTENVIFKGANTVKIPWLSLAGYKDHSRNGGFNRQSVKNDMQTMTLNHDRNVEFFIDTMDIDETNNMAAAANITNVFESEHAIPETDAYRISKIYSDYVANGGSPLVTSFDKSNILTKFDAMMEEMDNAEVPIDGRILYIIPTVKTALKQAADLQRSFGVQAANGAVERTVTRLDEVEVVVVPPTRMKTIYDFSDGFTAGVGAKQIFMMLIHPSSVIAVNKHNFIGLFPPGAHTQGDGFLYQNRQYWDAWVIKQRLAGIKIGVNA